MTKQINIYNYYNPIIKSDKSARFFSILSNNYPLSFNINDNTWNCISHYIYGNLLNCIPSFFENINFKNYKLDYPYDENFHNKKNLSLFTVDIFNYINTFSNNNKNFKKNLKTDMSYSTNSDNIILNVLSSDDFNLGKIYNRLKYLEETKNKVNNITVTDEKNIEKKTNLLLSIYTVIQGLKLIMYKQDNLNNLESFENFTFNQIEKYISDNFGSINLSYSINKYNIYNEYNNRTIEYFSIYEKILKNLSLKDNIVKLFIINNYQKFNSTIVEYCETQGYKQNIQNYLKEFIKNGEDPEDFDTESVPYQINDDENKKLLSLSLQNLLENKKEVLANINISCNIKKISEEKITSLHTIIKNIKTHNVEIQNTTNTPTNTNLNSNNNNNDDDDDDYKFNLNFEEQIVHSLNLSNKTLIDDYHLLSPLKNYETIIDNFKFNNIIEFIYYNEFYNLLNVNRNLNNNKKKAYELLFKDNTSEVKSLDELQDTYSNLFTKIITILFNNCIFEKLSNIQFNIALYYSFNHNLCIMHNNTNENFIESNVFGDLIKNLSKNEIKSPPDNYVNLLKMTISNNELVLNWLNHYITYFCNLYVSLSIHFNQQLSLEDYQIFINEWIVKKYDLDKYNTYVPPILDSFKFKVYCICNDLLGKYNILFKKNILNITVDISSIIWNILYKLIEFLYSFKQDTLTLKLKYMYLKTQDIELSYHSIKIAFNKIINLIKIDNLNVDYSIVISIILGIPISTKKPIDYIQTNPDSRKLPNSTEFYSHTKNQIYTFYE